VPARRKQQSSSLVRLPVSAQAQVKPTLPGSQPPLPRRRLQQAQPGTIMGRADVLDIPRPHAGDEQTICTAVAPDAVFTVRTYGTGHTTALD
jgi:hypothetical protein